MEGTDLDPRFMFELCTEGIIGTKEFRSWLANVDETFEAVRDSYVDNEIDRLSRERAEEIARLQEEMRKTSPPREG